MHLSDDISSTISLVLNGMTIASERTRGRLHFQDNGNQIRLYIPRDERLRELSWLTDVPEKIVSHFEIQNQRAPRVFGDVLKCSLIVLNDVLSSHGIVRVLGITAEPPQQEDATSSSLRSTGQRRGPEPAHDSRASSPSSTIVAETVPSPSSIPEALGIRASASPAESRREELVQANADRSSRRYRALLDHIIQSAQSDRGQVRLSDDVFVPDDVFGLRSTNPLLHDMKIGAAGELYVRRKLRSYDI